MLYIARDMVSAISSTTSMKTSAMVTTDISESTTENGEDGGPNSPGER